MKILLHALNPSINLSTSIPSKITLNMAYNPKSIPKTSALANVITNQQLKEISQYLNEKIYLAS